MKGHAITTEIAEQTVVKRPRAAILWVTQHHKSITSGSEVTVLDVWVLLLQDFMKLFSIIVVVVVVVVIVVIIIIIIILFIF